MLMFWGFFFAAINVHPLTEVIFLLSNTSSLSVFSSSVTVKNRDD